MATTKTTVSLFMATVPVVICAGLVFYFMSVPGRMAATIGMPEEATSGMTTQFGPTVIGVSAIGLLCAFALIIRMVRAASRVTPVSDNTEFEDDEPFDADAALARYLARKAAGGDSVAAPAPEAPAVAPLGFGRKSV